MEHGEHDLLRANVVQARRIEILDAEGNPRINLSVNDDGEPVFWIYDKAGKVRLSIGVNVNEEPGFTLYDSTEKLRAAFFMTAKDEPT